MGLRPAGFWAIVSTGAGIGGGGLLAGGLLTPPATAAPLAPSGVIVGVRPPPKGFLNRNGGVEFPLRPAAGGGGLARAGAGGGRGGRPRPPRLPPPRQRHSGSLLRAAPSGHLPRRGDGGAPP